MEFREMTWKAYYYISQIGNFVLQLLWHILHLIVSIYYFVVGIAHVLESNLISSGLWKKYKAFNGGKVRYLAIVVESEEAYQTSRIIKLLLWLEAIGVKYICLYDAEGVMKKSKDAILEELDNVTIFEEAVEKDKLVSQNCMTLEFASLADGKESVIKAANLLFEKYMKLADLDGDQEEKVFTEAKMANALKAIGCSGPEPDLLLVYGSARCHLGFPAWRIRYTEIVHMGSLAYMRYGSLVKAIYKFTMVRQNYGK
ncbi:dehydrodolichyl diphosphate synthase complex subunit NUS1 [Morus notabilis]|uniref:dehydrodolichyl diphosphate synthase complex subunit NUS1 n=1 Tax=Morus notabilis TaxID=981085 RepID=UPI000CED4278|nr:dehydrodolichyl diphosphate synthase complex subunit NUS1 [Morus notabilis]XP_024021262.1 dehydrodolichyl diphosphate synthase complex subunit NUS1 [Morus notabilis]XP_024021263.1 dehydrodolichyl diphosphate synthase complex subunit NUS1 [Morus notabilis]XP_024021264.1 dehydrodolichyl diphosphate synthase complex subunit NUS1 [Morus notabilis]XP_024021265.1 dehydrodolichyl diphosphate synthase complex subunit NUS1 [Morus notabilis]XP_024021266.1 dehydrodolichyl diphosphate synthase complex 